MRRGCKAPAASSKVFLHCPYVLTWLAGSMLSLIFFVSCCLSHCFVLLAWERGRQRLRFCTWSIRKVLLSPLFTGALASAFLACRPVSN